MRVGSLFSGIGGLDIAVADFFDAQISWQVENETHAGAVLKKHYPDVPNYGDIESVDFSLLKADIITAGYPCQPFSVAGKRAGVNDERHLWPYVATSLRLLRPRIAVFENVSGHLSLGFERVLSDLAAIGYDARWALFRASDIGAPHKRTRLFVLAADTNSGQFSWDEKRGDKVSITGQYVDRLELLPTPVVNDMGGNKTLDYWQSWTDKMKAKHDNNGHGKSLSIEARSSLQTYLPAISRWEKIIGRPAPDATVFYKQERLNPRFVEWMMGFPQDWVGSAPYTAQLKLLGNAVVPLQALFALTSLSEGFIAQSKDKKT